MNFEQEIKTLITSHHSIIYIVTEEENRLEYTLNYISDHIFKQKIRVWDFINGYKNNPNCKENAIKNPLQALDLIENSHIKTQAIFLLKDFNLFINDLSIIRKIKNLSQQIKRSKIYIVISSTELQIPNTLKEYITYINFPLPNKQEIKLELTRLVTSLNLKNNLSLDELSIAYQGFSINRIRQSISKIIINQKLDRTILKKIIQEKKIFIEATNLLNFYPSNELLENMGGVNNLKKWLTIRSYTFSKKAKNYGIPSPRGILLTGIQGTGKSLCAKAIAKQWNLPLLKLEVSKIFDSMLGESEKKFQQIIYICEQISPCILWIDEIDKIFTNSNNISDSGTSNRVNNIFLTWLSEKNLSIFIVATANNIKNLPIEITRKGRFDEIFFLDLPDFNERLDIFRIHLIKIRPFTWQKYNIYYLSKISAKFSGAEIRQVIIEAMYNAFYENREFDTPDIIKAIGLMIPNSFTNKEMINELQSLCKLGKIRPA